MSAKLPVLRRLEPANDFEVDANDLPRPADWSTVFGRTAPIVAEVGPGKGVFLTEYAKLHPERNLLGIEIRRKRVVKIAGRLARDRRIHARVIWGDAIPLFESLFAPASVRAVLVNFPDPWPKDRHAKRRLVRPPFARTVLRILEPGGELVVSTDVPRHLDGMRDAVESVEGFVNTFGPGGSAERLPDYPVSIHEWKFRAQGRTVGFLVFRKEA